jgi:hypothetical protein
MQYDSFIGRSFKTERVLKSCAWLLIFSAGFSIFVGLYSSFVAPSTYIAQVVGQLSPAKDALLLAGVLFALAGHLFTQGHTLAESKEKDSMFYLGSCVKRRRTPCRADVDFNL